MIGIELLASATEYFCLLFLLFAFFPRRENKKWMQVGSLIICGISHIALSMFTNDWQILPRMALILLNCFFVSRICFDGTIWKRILIILLFWAVAFTVDISVLTVCMSVMNWTAEMALSANAGYLLSMLASRSLLISFSFGCGYVARRQGHKGVRKGTKGIYLLIIPLYTIVGTGGLISNTILNGDELSSGIVALSGGLLVINVIVCIVINKLEQIHDSELEKQQLQAESMHNLKLAKNYQDSFNQQRKITHEFHNQLSTIHTLLAEKEYDWAASYVQHLQHITQETAPTIRTNHPIADAILNQKYQQAAQEGIGMLLYCNDLSAIPMEDGDLVTLLGNILDNAIAASAQAQEKRILVHLWQKQGIYEFVVRNSCPETSQVREPHEQMLHGFGTGLAYAVLDKYHYPYSAGRRGDMYIFSAILG